jgi:sugar phosphate isomerase/epimerase
MMKIGLRIPGACGREPFADFVAWCKEAGFDSMDLHSPDPERVRIVREAGLETGTFDLPGTIKLLSPEASERQEGIEAGIATIHAIADAGGDKAFCVFFPSNHQQSRKESFEYWKESFPVVAAEAEKRGVRIAVEGWPGPNHSALGVTPETLRAMFAAVPTEAFGINYDPSHLVRVGVDYKRFLHEFASRVIHAHGKDTALDDEGVYLYGNLGPTFVSPIGFGGGDWRYCIPGEGVVDWTFVCARLQQAGFTGTIAIELEDFRYNGSVVGEKLGLSRAGDFLTSLL